MRDHIFICSAIQICGGDSNYICEGMQPHIFVSTGFVEMHPLSFAVALLGFRSDAVIATNHSVGPHCVGSPCYYEICCLKNNAAMVHKRYTNDSDTLLEILTNYVQDSLRHRKGRYVTVIEIEMY